MTTKAVQAALKKPDIGRKLSRKNATAAAQARASRYVDQGRSCVMQRRNLAAFCGRTGCGMRVNHQLRKAGDEQLMVTCTSLAPKFAPNFRMIRTGTKQYA